MTNTQFIINNWPLVLALVLSGGMLAWPFVGRRFSAMREIGTATATQLINRSNAVMLDLREAKEVEGGRVPSAVHIPLSELPGRAQELTKFVGRPLIAYCARGNRSRSAASVLAKLGFTDLYCLNGGLKAWADAGMPVDRKA